MLYSNELKVNAKALSVPVKECIEEIQEYFNSTGLPVLHYDDYSIVIPVKVNVSIPPFGTIGGIDIKPEEPILIRIFLDFYPNTLPFIMSDRKDFPKEKLSHLYASNKKKPTGLCLVRNNPNEWFANKRMRDLLHVVEEWFFKAASGLLNDDGDEFDPIRLDKYGGQHIYQYETLFDIANKNERLLVGMPFSILLGSVVIDENKDIAFKSYSSISVLQIEPIKKLLNTLDPNDRSIEKPIFSILVWSDDIYVDNEYFTSLPASYLDLKQLLATRNIDLAAIIDFYYANGLRKINGIPIVFAIKRPKKMIGYTGDIEFVNFTIDSKIINKKGIIPDDALVSNQKHIEPFTTNLAALVSGQQKNKRTLFVGAGSLGSKMIFHEQRAGNNNISVVDDDTFLEHNLVRHALFGNHIGRNKAVAVIKEAESLFKFDKKNNLKAYPHKVSYLQKGDVEGHSWLVDSTASFNVQNWLTKTDLFDSLPDINFSRCELADEGKLGLLYIEGMYRNPRIDDLINVAYYEAINVIAINKWRVNDVKREVRNIDIGLGCSSTTSIVGDDLISIHAATFSQVLYVERDRTNIKNNGLIFINSVNNDGVINISTANIVESPFSILPFANNVDWEFRMRAGVEDKMFALSKSAKENETGGVLVGIANYKTKTVHVLDIIKAPLDSKGSPGRFKRGIKNLPETINMIKEKTGNMIGYIGEWHSHPMGLETLSTIDLENIETLKNENNKVPIPTCAIIISNNKTIPFIFF